MSSNETTCSEELKQFIKSCRTRALHDEEFGVRTGKQAQKRAIQIGEGLRNPRNRRAVLQAITGLPISSQKELTFWYHSVLIEETIDGHPDTLLREIEKAVEDTAGCSPWDLYVAIGPACNMPDLQPSHTGI
jgi:hypothetical protein